MEANLCCSRFFPGCMARVGHAVRGLTALLLLALPFQQAAAIQWDQPWNVRANGQRIRVETFSSRMSPDAVARELARANAVYQHYLVGDGRILLSGVRQGEHWLAEIQGRPDGSQGYVSALYFDAARASTLPVAASSGAGAPEAAVTRLSAAGFGVPQQVFEFDSSALIGMVSLPLADLATADVADMEQASPPGSGERNHGMASANGFRLMPAEAQPGMGLVVSIPEP